ncbi:matrix-remodeling-associated protein 7 isoform X3 [Antennarius striatus]|uniref:matrix-remodeling-associated protein 7 isoform X3 n=1 Tax=Antennarius striatus TaxID=241820 RepID=UPI0035B328DB
MDLTFVLSAAIFTLLALVVATSLLNGYSSTQDGAANSGSTPGGDESTPKLNGCFPEQKEEKAEDDWCEISGSSHDHWDVVKSVQSVKLSVTEVEVFEEHPHPTSGEPAPPLELSSSASKSLETEGAAESPEIQDKVESNETNSLKYVPGKARSHHLEMMMSTEELEEEQRVQREQLAAIFQLLQDNKETFGDLSEGDMEEQLRLYSI